MDSRFGLEHQAEILVVDRRERRRIALVPENAGAELGGGLAVTGNHPGKARTADELRADLDKALALIPGGHRLNLHASYADVQWALAGYTLAYALVLITGGRLGDIFGRKRLFLIGVTGFTIMSALCGAAQSPGTLIACRVVQGAMGAIMVPQVLAVIQIIFPPAERIKALAGFGVTAGLGTVSGPLIGGLITTAISWRAAFVFQALVIAVIVLLGRSLVDPVAADPADPPRRDLPRHVEHLRGEGRADRLAARVPAGRRRPDVGRRDDPVHQRGHRQRGRR